LGSHQAVAIVPVAKDVGPPGPRILSGYGHEAVVPAVEVILGSWQWKARRGRLNEVPAAGRSGGQPPALDITPGSSGLAHRALQPQQQPVVGIRGVWL
jgi:hypothetical protein